MSHRHARSGFGSMSQTSAIICGALLLETCRGVTSSPRLLQQAGRTTACATEIWKEFTSTDAVLRSDPVWARNLEVVLAGAKCAVVTASDAYFMKWLRFPAWFNGLATEWMREFASNPNTATLLKEVILDDPDGLPPLGRFTSPGSMRDYMVLQEETYSFTAADLSGLPSSTAWNRAQRTLGNNMPAAENVCINDTDPRGLIHPRTYLLMFSRADTLTLLHQAGRSSSPAPPDDWEGLIQLLAAHKAAVAEASSNSGSSSSSLPKHGLCLTMHPDCGRLGDVWAAIAASVVQTAGTEQGYVYDLSVPPPAAVPLVNGTGWIYAAETLRQLLAYNAPDNNAGGGSECASISGHFLSGDCMVTIEWDTVFPSFGADSLRKPGVRVEVSPLLGSRIVVDRRHGSFTAGQLVPCTWELCAASANHDLLYIISADRGSAVSTPALLAALQQLPPVAPTELIQLESNGSSGPASSCAPRAVMQVEAAAVAEVMGSNNPEGQQRLINRAPYSAVLQSFVRHSVPTANASSVLAFAAALVEEAFDLQVSLLYDMRSKSTTAARWVLGYPPSKNSSNGDSLTFLRTRWWKALAEPFQVGGYLERGISNGTAQSFCRALWHALHSPNAATDASSPIMVNFAKWGLSHAALQLGSSPADSAILNASHVFEMINEAFGNDLVRQKYVSTINAGNYVPPAPKPQVGVGGSMPISNKALAALLACLMLLVAVFVGAAVLMLVILHMRRRHRDLLGRVLAPGAGPNTTLLVSDMQDSGRLWEDLNPEAMDKATIIYNAVFRKLMPHHDAFESAMEGDSFTIAFWNPASALGYATACQLALLQQDWPAELLVHPCGMAVAAKTGETAADLLQSLATTTGAPASSRRSALPAAWNPCRALPWLWQQLITQQGGPSAVSSQAARSGAAAAGASTHSSSGPLVLHNGEGLESDSDGAAMELPELAHQQQQARASNSSADRISDAGLLTGGWRPGAASTWRQALAAAFPLLRTPGGADEDVAVGLEAVICTADLVLCYRGLRVRMGIHTGLDSEADVSLIHRRYRYSGRFAQTAVHVSDTAHGGLTTLSGQAFMRLRSGDPTAAANSGAVVVYAGHHIVYGTGGYVVVDVNGTSTIVETAPEEIPLFTAVPKALLCRFAHTPPQLRSCVQGQLGSLAAPIGTITVAFMKVVGASALLIDLPGPASRALDQFQLTARGLLLQGPRGGGEGWGSSSSRDGGGGYLVEGRDGLVLAAFASPLAGVEWALDCMEEFRRLVWDDELLAHELCEEVVTVDATVDPTAARVADMAACAAYSGYGGCSVQPPSPSGASHAGRIQHLRQPSTLQPQPPGLGALSSRGSVQIAAASRRTTEQGLRVKVGLDVGPITCSLAEASGRLSYRGEVMNRAARIAGTGRPGQVLCSSAVWLAREGALAAGFGGNGAVCMDGGHLIGMSLGNVALKGISTPVEIMQCQRGGE